MECLKCKELKLENKFIRSRLIKIEVKAERLKIQNMDLIKKLKGDFDNNYKYNNLELEICKKCEKEWDLR